jgi:hypothetical protein
MKIRCNDVRKKTSNYLNSRFKSNFRYNNKYSGKKLFKIQSVRHVTTVHCSSSKGSPLVVAPYLGDVASVL